MQGPDPSLAYRPNLENNKTKEKKDYRNFEVRFETHLSVDDNYLMLHTFKPGGKHRAAKHKRLNIHLHITVWVNKLVKMYFFLTNALTCSITTELHFICIFKSLPSLAEASLANCSQK